MGSSQSPVSYTHLDVYKRQAINNVFMKQSKEKRAAFINDCLSYLRTNHTMPQIYPLFIRRIDKYTQIFNDLSYERFKVIEFDELIDRFKKELHTKAMNLSMKIFDRCV